MTEIAGTPPVAARRTVGTELKSRSNNFDFIRLFAAFLVILSHSYPITFGIDSREPLRAVSHYTTLGEVAVAVFFVISGLLVARSYLSEPKPLAYLRKRSLRIFPGLIACTAFCVLVVGPLFTTLHLPAYFKDHETRRFLRNVFMWPTFELPGVFKTNALNAVNGSLWSLPFEFMMYIVVLGLGMTRALNRLGVGAVAVAMLGFYIFLVHPSWTDTDFVDRHALLSRGLDYLYGHPFIFKNLALFGFLFLAGTLLLLFKDHVPLDWRLASLCAAALIASCFLGDYRAEWGPVIFCLTLPYLIIYLAFIKVPHLHLATKWGDFSYGVYLYAFPVQQMVMHIERRQPTWMPFPLYVAVCSAITLGLAILSWFFVEKPMLKLKKKTLHPVDSAPRTVPLDPPPASGSQQAIRSADPAPASATNRVMGVP